MVTWVLESNIFSERCFDEMIKHFKEKDIPFHVIKIIPFIHEAVGEVPVIEGPVVSYGSIGMQNLTRREGWRPGTWTGPELNESSLIANLGDMYLNNDALVMRLEDAVHYSRHTSPAADFFIKPNEDTKIFAGHVYTVNAIKQLYDNLIRNEIDTNFDVVISDYGKKIDCEWRLVVVDGKIAAHSCYKQYQQVMPEIWMPDEVLEFAEKVIKKYNPLDVFVMDICESEGELKVIEYNTFNSSGLYRLDVGLAIDSINKMINT